MKCEWQEAKYVKLSAGKASAKAPSKVCSITTIFLPKQKEEEKVKI